METPDGWCRGNATEAVWFQSRCRDLVDGNPAIQNPYRVRILKAVLANLTEKRHLPPESRLKKRLSDPLKILNIFSCLGSGCFGKPPGVFDLA
jgi:hypothetical protein